MRQFLIGSLAALVLISGVSLARNIETGGSVREVYNWDLFQIVFGTMLDAEVSLEASAREVNANSDLSERVITLTEDTTATIARHAGKVLLLGEVGGNATLDVTLPEATGSGAKFYFQVSVANTSGYEVQVASDDVFEGSVGIIDGNLQDTANLTYDYTANGSDTLNMDSDAECGDVGDWAEFTDILTDVYAVRGVCRSNGAAYTTVWATEVP